MWRAAVTIGLSTTLAGCGANSFTDRQGALHFPAPPSEKTTKGKGVATPTLAAEKSEPDTIAAFNKPVGSDATVRNGLDRETYRNSVIWRQIAADDDSFHQFVRALRADRALMNMSADGGAIVLNGLGAVLGTAAEKAALATLSAGLLAARGSVDRELFNLETMSALLARMKAARLAALVPLRRGMTLSAAQYPLEQALVDLRAYARAGSLLATIEAVSEDAGVVAVKAEAQVAVIERDTVFRDSRAAVTALSTRVATLSDKQALALAFAMERAVAERDGDVQSLLNQRDPAATRFVRGDNARQFLLFWLQYDRATAGELQEWESAVTLAEKAPR
jgi:hypothetical protein